MTEEKELALDEKILDINSVKMLRVREVKTFIEKETQLINQFARGKITLSELHNERIELIGEGLVK